MTRKLEKKKKKRKEKGKEPMIFHFMQQSALTWIIRPESLVLISQPWNIINLCKLEFVLVRYSCAMIADAWRSAVLYLFISLECKSTYYRDDRRMLHSTRSTSLFSIRDINTSKLQSSRNERWYYSRARSCLHRLST